MSPQILELYGGRQLVLDDFGKGLGEKCLSSGSQGAYSRTAIDRRAVVVSILIVGGSNVKRGSDADGSVLRPIFLMERDLNVRDGGKGFVGFCEDREGAVSLSANSDEVPLMVLDSCRDDVTMAFESHKHLLWKVIPEMRATLNIRKEKGESL